MLGFAEYCRESGQVRFVKCFSSLSMDCSVLAILASTHYYLCAFCLGLVLGGLVLEGCTLVHFACLVGFGYSLPVWVVMVEGSAPHNSPHFGQSFQGQDDRHWDGNLVSLVVGCRIHYPHHYLV